MCCLGKKESRWRKESWFFFVCTLLVLVVVGRLSARAQRALFCGKGNSFQGRKVVTDC